MAVELEVGAENSQADASPASKASKAEALGLAAILIFFFLAAIHSARLRPFWFDELSTLFMASAPTVRGMFQAIPTDGNPPLYFILARLFLRLPVKTELALRLPSILAFTVASFAVYRFVRRDAGRVFAFLAMSVFMGCPFHNYAIEARPYSLLLAFTGLALVCWQSYCRTGRRKALAGLALSIAGAIFSHQYGALYAILPIVAGEAVRGLRRRTIDPRVAGAAAIAASALLLTYPVMLRAQKPLLSAIRACPVFFAHPKSTDLKYYALTLPPFNIAAIGLTLILLLIKAALATRKAEHEANGIPKEDLAVAWTLSLLLPIMLIATRLGTNFFQFRYAIGSSLGISMLSGFLLSRLRWRYAAVAAWTLTAYSLIAALLGIFLATDGPMVHPWLDPILRAADPSEPIVVASALEYSPMWWYGGTMRGRLHYLEDLPYAGRHSDLIAEYSLALEHEYTPMQMDSYQAFVDTHRHFLLYCYGEDRLEWIEMRLLKEGWHLKLLSSAQGKEHDELRSGHRELFLASR